MQGISNRRTGASLLTMAAISIALTLTLAGARTASAQVLYGSILGNVKDSSEAAVPGATVTATNVGTNQSRQAFTNESGSYSFSDLQGGIYSFKVTQQGFKTFEQTSITVSANNLNRVDTPCSLAQSTKPLRYRLRERFYRRILRKCTRTWLPMN